MHLFKRILLSLFPEEIAANNMNPASMFVSFISTKEFFSVINRKIVENYKLNLFDITLDPFEFKIGFGNKPSVKLKDIDMYYSYCATANMNGYRFLNPSNISNAITLVVSIYTKHIFEKHESNYTINFLYTVYLLTFVFAARIKVFPFKDKEHNYNWFIEVFFHFYTFVSTQTGKEYDPKILNKIKKELLGEIEILFLLFEYYKHINTLFWDAEVTDNEFYNWIFYDEIKEENFKKILKDFIENIDKYKYKSNFSDVENKILQLILPADVLLKYLFNDENVILIIEYVITKIYDKKKLDEYVGSFLKGNEKLKNFLLYITDHRNLKKNFFKGVQKYVITVFRDEKDIIQKEEIDEFMSSIGDDIENIESFKIPERIKKESQLMEKMLNFYITLIGGFWIARGNNFFIRLFKPQLIKDFLKSADTLDSKKATLHYYGTMLYQYGKNIFYYKYASDNVRAGKQKFYLPYKSDIKEVYSNMCILRLMDENALSTLLQDINPKDIRLFIKHDHILEIFKKKRGKTISECVKQDQETIFEKLYGNIGALLLKSNQFISILKEHLNEKDLYHLKDNIYNFDVWLHISIYEALLPHRKEMQEEIGDLVILGILAHMKETLLGFLLYYTFLITQKKGLQTDFIKTVYIKEILNIPNVLFPTFEKIIMKTYTDNYDLLHHWIDIDDNPKFFKIGMENRSIFINKKNLQQIENNIIGEDMIWFRGFLKNITYYNKRFLIPK